MVYIYVCNGLYIIFWSQMNNLSINSTMEVRLPKGDTLKPNEKEESLPGRENSASS